MKIKILLFFIPVLVYSQPMYSPTWGFRLDLPPGYEYIDGDARDRFSFSGPGEAMLDIIIYNGIYGNISELASDVNRRLNNRGDTDFFIYNNKQAAVIELDFGNSGGWGLCVELTGNSTEQNIPMLLALAYGPPEISDLNLFHFSALDSIVPSDAERFFPGPITEYSFPRGERKRVSLTLDNLTAMIYENDAEAAQVLIEREFYILQKYLLTYELTEAWQRYYRFIYRDSYSRIADAVSVLVRHWRGNNAVDERTFAQKALEFVQGFEYERNFEGSDFVNLVTAVTERRNNCDSRVVLWALLLNNAGIRAAMMISPHYGHAMGLADIAGSGARFEAYNTRWLVAETTDSVDIGLIAQDVSDPQYWIGILFQ